MNQYIKNTPGYVILTGLVLIIVLAVIVQKSFFNDVTNPWAKNKDYGCYEYSGGVANTSRSGEERFLDKAKEGDIEAQRLVGNFYRFRSRLPPDEHGQIKYVGRKVQLGIADPDYPEALKWYKRAAAQGSTTAQDKVADMYFNGYGVNQDFKEAYFWASLATEIDMKEHAEDVKKYSPNKEVNNSPRCSYDSLRRKAIQNLSGPEIEEVEKRIKEWKPVLERQP